MDLVFLTVLLAFLIFLLLSHLCLKFIERRFANSMKARHGPNYFPMSPLELREHNERMPSLHLSDCLLHWHLRKDGEPATLLQLSLQLSMERSLLELEGDCPIPREQLEATSGLASSSTRRVKACFRLLYQFRAPAKLRPWSQKQRRTHVHNSLGRGLRHCVLVSGSRAPVEVNAVLVHLEMEEYASLVVDTSRYLPDIEAVQGVFNYILHRHGARCFGGVRPPGANEPFWLHFRSAFLFSDPPASRDFFKREPLMEVEFRAVYDQAGAGLRINPHVRGLARKLRRCRARVDRLLAERDARANAGV